MLHPKTLTITDDAGFLAIVNADQYKPFVNEAWTMPQLLNRFSSEMNRDNLIIWSTGSCRKWTVDFLQGPSGKKAYRTFCKIITVTNGQLFLTNFEDLTMAAQFEEQTIPARHNIDLDLQIDNGTYEFQVRQLFDPLFDNPVAGNIDFEVVVSHGKKEFQSNADHVFWWNL